MNNNYVEEIIDNICFAIDRDQIIEIRFFHSNEKNFMFAEIKPIEVEQDNDFVYIYADGYSLGIDLGNVENCGEDGYYCHGTNSTFVLNFREGIV